jgi:hypothetical protein
MTGLVYLDVAIGLVFTVLVFSLVATAAQEAIAGFFSWRAAGLRAGIRNLVGSHFAAFWNEPLIASVRPSAVPFARSAGTGEDDPGAAVKLLNPSYMSPQLFAKALLGFVKLGGMSPAEIVAELQKPVPDELKPLEDLRRQVLLLVQGVEGSAAEAERMVAAWFDASMSRVSGWYVRRVKLVLFIIGLALAAGTNTNLFVEAGRLLSDDDLRRGLVASAEAMAGVETLQEAARRAGLPEGSLPGPEDPEALRAAIAAQIAAGKEALARTAAPRGWVWYEATVTDRDGRLATARRIPGFENGVNALVSLVSFILLAFLITLGAQFWFDLLKSFVAIRAAGAQALAGPKPAG